VGVFSENILQFLKLSWYCFSRLNNLFSHWQAIKELSSRGNIRLKRMGELDTRPFLEAIQKRYKDEDVEEVASAVCSLWEEHLKNPDWHPFKVIMVEGKEKVPVKHIDLVKLS